MFVLKLFGIQRLFWENFLLLLSDYRKKNIKKLNRANLTLYS